MPVSDVRIVKPEDFKPIARVVRDDDGNMIVSEFYGELRYGFPDEDANGVLFKPLIELFSYWKMARPTHEQFNTIKRVNRAAKDQRHEDRKERQRTPDLRHERKRPRARTA